MDSPFARAWAATGRAEGGYVDNPNDPGGATNHGITEKVARAHGYLYDMRELTLASATAIAKQEYWDPLRLDEVADISEAIAAELFDTNFNMWHGAAVTFLQRQLNVLNGRGQYYPELKVDGVMGDATLDALRAYKRRRGADGTTVLLRGLNAEQAVDYRRQCEANEVKEDFYYGWLLNRVAI